MIYGDTDFILALIKKKDWLKKDAEKIHSEFEDEILISTTTLTELMLLAEKIDYDPRELLAAALEIAKIVDGDSESYFMACEYMKRYGLNVFDALHLAKCNGRIISSDKKFIGIPGLEVIKLG
jgi:predicted nucleic acid-binding protein